MKRALPRFAAMLLVLVLGLELLPAGALAAGVPELVLGTPSGGNSSAVVLDYKSISYEPPEEGAAAETCILTRVIQYCTGREETLTDTVYKNTELRFNKPTPSPGAEFGAWHYKDGGTFTGKVSQDTTIYLTEAYRDELCTVTYSPNGGTLQTSSVSVPCGTEIQLPQVTPPAGYTFLGWYSGTPQNGALNSYAKWSDGAVVTKTVTLYAMWAEQNTDLTGESLWVSFDYAGGTDQNGDSSGLIITLSGPDLTVDRPEDPIREGYCFLGWATESGELWDGFGAPLKESLRLYAKWGPAICTVTFDWGGLNIRAVEPITVKNGATALPGLKYVSDFYGHRQVAWADADGVQWVKLQNGRATVLPITRDLVLYPVWDPALDEEDTFSFSNSSAYFRGTYAINADYLDYLLQGEPTSYQANLRRHAAETWGGSCFGLSTVYALKYADKLDPGMFQAGADRLFDLECPADSTATNDLINFYHLNQYTLWIQNAMVKGEAASAVSQNRSAVQQMESTKAYAVLTFIYVNGETGGISGHAIVGKSISQDSAGDYHIQVWDNNNPFEPVDGELIISSDFTRASFDDEVYGGSRYNNQLRLTAVLTVESGLLTRKDLQQYVLQGKGQAVQAQAADFLVLESSLADFKVTAADGRTATVENGRQTGGELVLTYLPDLEGTEASGSYRFALDAADGADITVDTANRDSSVSVLSDTYYAAIDAEDLTSVRFAEGLVDSTAASAARQTITYASDQLGTTWNQMEVSGTDTGFTLEAGTERVTISTDSPVEVQVTGSNVSDGRVSAAQTVAAAPAGVTVATNSGSLAAAEGGGTANPFTDVPADAYYKDAVLWAVEHGVTNGTNAGGTLFSPDVTVSRAQAVTFLWRACGAPEPSSTVNPFADVPAGAYYYKAVLWAVEQGITNGTNAQGTTFSPDATLTRGQAVTFQWRAAGAPAASGSGFSDVDGGAYYASAVAWAVANGITNGTNAQGTLFSPEAPVSRAQAVTFLWRQLG